MKGSDVVREVGFDDGHSLVGGQQGREGFAPRVMRVPDNSHHLEEVKETKGVKNGTARVKKTQKGLKMNMHNINKTRNAVCWQAPPPALRWLVGWEGQGGRGAYPVACIQSGSGLNMLTSAPVLCRT